MGSNTTGMIEQLKKNPSLAQEILSSDDGRTLLEALSQGTSGKTFQQATEEAARGNTKALSSMLSGIMSTPEGSALIRRLGDSVKKHIR